MKNKSLRKVLSVLLALSVVLSTFAGVMLPVSASESTVAGETDIEDEGLILEESTSVGSTENDGDEELPVAGEEIDVSGGATITTDSADFAYTISDGAVTITKYNGADTVVVIPGIIDGYPVTKIGGSAFANCTTIESVTVPVNVTVIDGYAFSECTSLKEINLPDGLTTIYAYAFQNCAFETLKLPDSITTMSARAFFRCALLSEVNYPLNLTTVLTWNNGIWDWDIHSPFDSCVSLKEITVPEGVTNIPAHMFRMLDYFETVNLPETLTTIEKYAFDNCKGLKSITIPSGVTSIGNYAFNRCTVFTDVFYEGTEEQWNKVAIGSNNDPLINATIHFALGETNSADFEYTIADGAVTITKYNGDGTEVVIPSAIETVPVKVIDNAAFKDCTAVTNIVVPNGITTIGSSAFEGCTSLAGIKLPNTVSSIGNYAFRQCSALTEIDIPEGVTAIGDHLFYGCSALASISIPSSVQSIGTYAFYSCTSVTSIALPEGITAIGSYAFYGCNGLTSITLPAGVVSIGDSAFNGCNKLGSINLSEGLETIGKSAFSGCSALTGIVLPDGVTAIGDYAFTNCIKLSSITIPYSLTNIGKGAFNKCSALADVYYGGNEEQWSGITIGSYNNPLSAATIHYTVCECEYGDWLTRIAPTCEEDGINYRVCSKCGKEETATVSAVGHSFTDWSYGCYHSGEGEEGGAVELPEAGGDMELFSVSEVTYDYFKTRYCLNCSSEETVQLTEDEVVLNVETVEATCQTEGYTLYSCPYCDNYSYKDNYVSATGHSFTDWSYGCYHSGEGESEIPDFGDEFGMLSESEYLYSYYKYHYCIYCSVSETIAVADEEIELIIEDTTADCTNNGYHTESCPYCGLIIRQRLTEYAWGHKIYTDVIAPTCLNMGYSTEYCSNCDYYRTYDYVPELGHNYEETVTAPTCTSGGYSEYNCRNCGNYYTSDHVDALGHSYNVTVVPYTCIENGKEIYDCIRCDYSYTKIIYARHASSDTDGLCDFCNDPIVGILDLVFVIDTTGSMSDAISVVKANIKNYIEQLEANAIPNYVAIVDYRDFPDRGDSGDYAYKVILDLTNDMDVILDTVDRIGLGYGGDFEETVYSGLMNGLDDLHWGVDSVKRVVLIGDAPPLDPEPYTGYTCEQVCEKLNEDGVMVYAISVSGDYISAFDEIATATGGNYYECYGTSEFNQVIVDIMDEIPTNVHIHNYEESYIDATCTTGKITIYTCSGCGKVVQSEGEPLGHDYTESITAPTCTEQGYTTHTCTRCDSSYVDGYVDELGHNYNAVVTQPTCTEQGYTTHTCTRCPDSYVDSYVEPLGHRYGEWMYRCFHNNGGIEMPDWDEFSLLSEYGYGNYYEKYRICSVCDYEEIEYISESDVEYIIEVVNPTCTEQGYTIFTCPYCLGYSFNGNYVEALGHRYGEWLTRTEATCTNTGVKYRICAVCEEEETGSIPALGHNYNAVVTQPTCTEQGYTTHTCTRCLDNYIDSYVEALGHSYGEWLTRTEPTCTNTGVKYRICAVCEEEETESIPALGHNYNAVVTQPTCTEQGYTTHTCTRCPDSYVDSYVEALGHSYGEWLTRTEPTCTNTGVKYRICAVCEEEETGSIPALGHNYNAVVTQPTCMEQGYTTHTCTRCLDNYIDSYVEPLGHSYGEWLTRTEATCTNTGVKYRICAVCEEEETESIPALGHNYRTVSVAPTCIERGYTEHICERCGYSYKDSYTGFADHTYGEWIFEKVATVLNEGSKYRICSVCGNRQTSVIDKIIVDINTNPNYGLANFTVVNAQTLEPISGAQLFIHTETDGEQTFITDANGKVSVVLPVGKHQISAFATGCISRNLNVKIKSGVNDISRIGLSDLPVYDAEITHERMTLEEIEEAGIDTSDPANQHVYRYELKLDFGPEIDVESIFAYFNGDGKPVTPPRMWVPIGPGIDFPDFDDTTTPSEPTYNLHYHVANDGYWHSWCKTVRTKLGADVALTYYPWRDNPDYVFDGWYADPEFTQKIYSKHIDSYTNYVYGRWIYIGEDKEPITPNGIPVITKDGEKVATVYPITEYFYLIVRGEIRWLKEMFDVEMLIINNSQTDTLQNLKATLELPEGLSLAAMVGEEQTLTQEIDYIGEGDCRSVRWFVRGDKAGSYDIVAKLQGMIMPFEEEIDDHFKSENKLQVWAGDALNLHFEFPNAAYYGEDYPITITLTNVSDITLYNVSHMVSIVQGMEIYYSDGTSKKRIEESEWYSIGVREFHPGDKIIIVANVNIFFESEIMANRIEQLISFVDGMEQIINGYKAINAAAKAAKALSKCVKGCISALDKFNVSSLDMTKAKNKAFAELYSKISTLLTTYSTTGNSTVDAVAKFSNSGLVAVLNVIANDPEEWLKNHAVKDITDLTKKITALTNNIKSKSSSTRKFEIFDSIRTAISALPIKYVLKSVAMTEDVNNTTDIPWSYTVTDAGPHYFGVSNVSKYLMSLIKAAAGEMWDASIPWYFQLIPGIDDVFDTEEAIRYIQATEDEIAQFKAKDATGLVSFKAWVERNSAIAEDDFTLSCDNETATYEDGVLSFTGDGLISLTPTSSEGGILHIEDDKGNSYLYDIDVVEQHECVMGEREVIISPTEENEGFAVKCCEKCNDVMDIEILTTDSCAEGHSFGEWVTETESTCSELGVKYHVCAICGNAEYDFIEMKEHNYSDEWTVDVEPTFTTEGSKSHHCLNCDSVTDVTVIPALGTDFTYEIVDGEAVITGYNGSKTELEIPALIEGYKVTKIADDAFYNKQIISISIPESIVYIGYWAFGNCDSLTKVYYDGTEEQWNDIVISYGNTALLNAEIEYPGEKVLGDINGDSLLNSADLIKLRKILLGTDETEQEIIILADVNEDGEIDIRDLVRLKKIIAESSADAEDFGDEVLTVQEAYVDQKLLASIY